MKQVFDHNNDSINYIAHTFINQTHLYMKISNLTFGLIALFMAFNTFGQKLGLPIPTTKTGSVAVEKWIKWEYQDHNTGEFSAYNLQYLMTAGDDLQFWGHNNNHLVITDGDKKVLYSGDDTKYVYDKMQEIMSKYKTEILDNKIQGGHVDFTFTDDFVLSLYSDMIVPKAAIWWYGEKQTLSYKDYDALLVKMKAYFKYEDPEGDDGKKKKK